LQKSLLSPFLFNLYFTELDKFIEKLKAQILIFNDYKDQKSVITKFRCLQRKFSKNEKFNSDLEKYGSLELIVASYNKEKKIFFKKYGYCGGVN
jgi:hypothetical protein